jgi:hypothetical protein
VRTSDVDVADSTAPDPGTDRYNILGRDSSGVLWQYQGSGSASAPFLTRYRVGPGWNAYDMVTSLTALRADGTGDMVARDKSGLLWYYKGSGNPSAPFEPRTKIGGGWYVYDTVTGARDLTGDGEADLVARDTNGELWLYKGTGNATAPYQKRAPIGGGWNIYSVLRGPSDLNRDGLPDLIARDKDGVLWFYRGTGSASAPFAPRTRIGSGWNMYGMII